MCDLPYFIKAHVLNGDNFRFSKIVETIQVPARLIKDRQVIYPPNRPNGLHPGVYTGDMTPILKRSDVY